LERVVVNDPAPSAAAMAAHPESLHTRYWLAEAYIAYFRKSSLFNEANRIIAGFLLSEFLPLAKESFGEVHPEFRMLCINIGILSFLDNRDASTSNAAAFEMITDNAEYCFFGEQAAFSKEHRTFKNILCIDELRIWVENKMAQKATEEENEKEREAEETEMLDGEKLEVALS